MTSFGRFITSKTVANGFADRLTNAPPQTHNDPA